MPIIRSKTDSNYFVMHNATAQDDALSWEARGMLAYLLSKPEGWKTNLTDLTRQSGAGKDKCRRIMDDLITAGYVERVEVRESGKFARYDFHVYDTIQGAKPATIAPELAGTPEPAKPEAVKPEPANPPLIKNRDIQNTEAERTETPSVVSPVGKRRRVPPDWMPDDRCREYAAERGNTDAQIADLVEQFRDHHGGKGTLFADIAAGWRTWVRNDIKFNGPPAERGSDGRRGGREVDAFARAQAELETRDPNDIRFQV